MANQNFKRQIDRIKTELDVIKPKPPATVINEPGPDADLATVAAYREQLEQARHSKNGLVVIGFPRPGHAVREQVRGVQFVESEWEAALVTLAGQPPGHGGRNGLDDFLKSLPGKVLGVTATVPADIHQRSATLDQ